MGGSPLNFGSETIGQAMNAPVSSSGGWNLARIADLSLAQAAYQLANKNRVWLPSMSKADAASIPITTVEKIGQIGPYHADINGNTTKGGIRGPFDISMTETNSSATYPVLWAHDAKRERTMAFDGDSEGFLRRATTKEEQAAVDLKAAKVWSSASHCHFNRDFRFNSQSTAMQFTPRKTIGGHAWTSVQLSSVDHEKALVLWANTSLGLLLRWWHSNKQQSGRGRIGKSSLATLPVLDVTQLKPKQLGEAAKLFDTMSGDNLLPMNEIDRDLVRTELDEKFGRDVLGLPGVIVAPGGPVELLRMKLSKEPSVRGSK